MPSARRCASLPGHGRDVCARLQGCLLQASRKRLEWGGYTQVLRKHHPHLKIHPDLRTLDLASVHEALALDVVVISTPCTDVSCRGAGLAQQGQACHELHRHCRELNASAAASRGAPQKCMLRRVMSHLYNCCCQHQQHP